MFEKVTGIKIEGKCFYTPTPLVLFPKEKDRIALVYGRNGSGKSTIAAGFNLIATNQKDLDIKAEFTYRNVEETNKNNKYKNIYVFDENFIENNIKIDKAGLATIVLFGEQVDIDKQIESIKKLKDIELVKLDAVLYDIDKYRDKREPLSPEFHYQRIVEKLNSDWAERVQKIKNYKIKAAVTKDIVNQIGSLNVDQSLNVLEEDYKSTFELYNQLNDSNISYPEQIKNVVFDQSVEDRIIKLLAKVIKESVLTEREKMILSAISNGRQKEIEEAKGIFENPNTIFCPYCFQNVSETYKRELVNSINIILNKEVDEHKLELKQAFLSPIELNIERYKELGNELTAKISDIIINCNKLVDEYNKLLEKKINNIYTPIEQKHLGLYELIIKLNAELEHLEKKRIDFNNARKAKKETQEKLLLLNKQIANLKIKEDYTTYIRQQKSLEEKNSEASKIQRTIDKYNEKINMLNAQKENVGIAIKSINNALKCIFFSDKCLSIELRDNLYYLKVNGKHVQPKNISSGERNLIALCYYFTLILNKQSITNLYNDEQFIIIDDPISSFDFENKIGMLSYLKGQIRRIVLGNNNSKVLVMSHDLTTVINLRKAMEEICAATKANAKIRDTTFSVFELENKSLKQFNYNRSEYTESLQAVYNYAKDKSDLDSLSVGNAMRRVLEAFSKFIYKKSIEDISCDPEIQKWLGDKSDYFQDLMYRLVLHGESHFKDRINTMDDNINLFDFITEDEKQGIAKGIICMMYKLNRQHIIAHLSTVTSAVTNIERWLEEIPSNEDLLSPVLNK